MGKRKGLRVVEQVALDQVRGEVAEVVAPDAAAEEAELLQVAAMRDCLVAEVFERCCQVSGKGPRKVNALNFSL